MGIIMKTKPIRTLSTAPVANTSKPIKPDKYWFFPLIASEVTRRMTHNETLKQARKFHAASCQVLY